MKFTDKVIIITGAGSGIGQATALHFAKEDAIVIVVDLNETHGRETEQKINQSKGRAQFIKCDVGKLDDLKNVVEQTIKRWQRIDVVVNNAAIMSFGPLVDLDIEKWDSVIATNLRSVFLLCKFALPYISGGAIINISSVHAHETTPNNSAYAASKGGIEALTRALSLEVNSDVCRVNAIAPGAINTPMLWENPNIKNGVEKVKGKVGEPKDIAAAICFLASNDARFINGTTLVVDGGRLDHL